MDETDKHVTKEDVSDDKVLTGLFRPMGRTTGVLVVPDLDTSQVRGVGYDLVENEEYQDGEILKVYFKLTSNSVGYRYYRIPEQYRPFVVGEMDNFSVAPPAALEVEE